VEPSAEQQAFWSGRSAQWEATVGRGPGRLLDVGCGFGHFVQWALSAGWDAWGCEPDPWARERTLVAERVAASLDAVSGSFDIVTLWDVLEHVPAPIEFAASLPAVMRPGGRVLVCSPNFSSVKLRWPIARLNYQRFNSVVQPEEHFTQFTETGLRLTLQRAGFTTVTFMHPPLARGGGLVERVMRFWPALRPGLFACARAPQGAGSATGPAVP
jgi:SAM-dependent methyltransferase